MRIEFGQGFAEGFVTAGGDVFLQAFGIDVAAIGKRHLDLFLVKGHFLLGCDDLLLVLQHQALDGTALDKMLRDDLVHVFDPDGLVENPFRIDHHHGSVVARTHAAGLDDVDLLGDPFLSEQGVEAVLDLKSAC